MGSRRGVGYWAAEKNCEWDYWLTLPELAEVSGPRQYLAWRITPNYLQYYIPTINYTRYIRTYKSHWNLHAPSVV